MYTKTFLNFKIVFKICELNTNSIGTHWIDNEVQGKLVAVSKIVQKQDMTYEKVVNIYHK